MRKYTAIFLLLLLLLSQTTLQEMLRLPVLFAHYQEHKSLKADISFLSFLRLHYFSEHAKDDAHRQKQLPFHNSDILIISSQVVLPQLVAIEGVPTEYRELVYPRPRTPHPLARQTAEIWQPPRKA